MSYKCGKCGKKFRSKEKAEKHEKRCNNKKDYCQNCGKELSFFSKMNDVHFKKRFCGLKCAKKHKDKKKGKIIEFKCKCKSCSNIWHYLPKEEKQLKSQARSNALIGCGTCGSPCGAFFSNKSIDLQREADKFKKCPKCGSVNITKKEIEHEVD